ncbi:MAG: sigma-70 family RNA polymerase sigma factor [Bryobacteraceae bacterium]
MAEFPSTRRSVLLATRSADSDERRFGYERLIGDYWKPVYKYVRIKWRANEDEAQDLTQGFFARAMEKSFFASFDPSKAAFRTFLRTCLDGYVQNERKAAARLKRGGGVAPVALDFEGAEGELRLQLVSPDADPEEFFHQEWRRSVMSASVEELRALCEQRGKQTYFDLFSRYDLDPDDGVSYESLAREFGLTAVTVTNYLAWAASSGASCASAPRNRAWRS